MHICCLSRIFILHSNGEVIKLMYVQCACELTYKHTAIIHSNFGFFSACQSLSLCLLSILPFFSHRSIRETDIKYTQHTTITCIQYDMLQFLFSLPHISAVTGGGRFLIRVNVLWSFWSYESNHIVLYDVCSVSFKIYQIFIFGTAICFSQIIFFWVFKQDSLSLHRRSHQHTYMEIFIKFPTL